MNEEAKQKQPTHGPYDEAFKRAAVAPWMSGVPARQVAAGLGITAESLRTWRKRQEGNVTPRGAVATAAPSAPTPGELQAEVRRRRAQLQSVTNQRDILKTTVGIFAGPNGSVSP